MSMLTLTEGTCADKITITYLEYITNFQSAISLNFYVHCFKHILKYRRSGIFNVKTQQLQCTVGPLLKDTSENKDTSLITIAEIREFLVFKMIFLLVLNFACVGVLLSPFSQDKSLERPN